MPKAPIVRNIDPTLNATIGYIMRHRKTMYRLSCVDNLIGRHLWQRMFFIKMMDSLFENVQTCRYTSQSDYGQNALTRICEFNAQNLLVGENNDIKTFIQNNTIIVYSDAQGQIGTHTIAVDDNLQKITELKPNLPYRCVYQFVWRLMTSVDLNNSNDVVCDTLYKILNEYLECNVIELMRKRKIVQKKSSFKCKKLKIC